MATRFSLVSLLTGRQRTVQKDWAPARIVSLRYGDLRSSLYYLRYSPAQAEVEVRGAPTLESQVSDLQVEMLFAVVVVLLLAMLLGRLLDRVSNGPMRVD